MLLASRHRWQADERSLLLACYNAGPTRVARASFDMRRMPLQTLDYAERVMTLHDDLLARHDRAPAGAARAADAGAGMLRMARASR